MAPWLRRLVTRLLALVPAVAVIALTGEPLPPPMAVQVVAGSVLGAIAPTAEQATQGLLILSQVILSLQLSFAVIPLIHFTSNRRNMGEFATPWWGQILAWTTAGVIVALNAKLVWDQIGEWVQMAADSGSRSGRSP